MTKKETQTINISTDTDSENTMPQEWMTDDAEGQLLLDVYQDEKNIYIKSTIAGVKPEDLQISLNNDMLTIRGTRDAEMDVTTTDYFYQECYWGSFSRSIILPMEIKQDKIKASLKNGVLTVTLPKAKKRTSIPIDVKE